MRQAINRESTTPSAFAMQSRQQQKDQSNIFTSSDSSDNSHNNSYNNSYNSSHNSSRNNSYNSGSYSDDITAQLLRARQSFLPFSDCRHETRM